MKSRTLACITGMTLFIGLAIPDLAIPADASAPTVTLSPASLTFWPQGIGTTSTAKTVTLKNTGTGSLAISSFAITGINVGDFFQSTTCGATLAASASCRVSIMFKPKALGTRAAYLSVADNASGSPQQVRLSGIGTTASLSTTKLSLGSVWLGTTSPPKEVTLTNLSTIALDITSIAITGTDAGDFAQIHTCESSLAAGASCTVSVTFTPAVAGTRIATLKIADNAAGSPQKVALNGTGVTVGQCRTYGEQCYPGHPCCRGLVCVPASTRAFCFPGTTENLGAKSWYQQANKSEDSTPILKDALPEKFRF